MPQVNPGSLYRLGRSTQEQAVGHDRRKEASHPPKTILAGLQQGVAIGGLGGSGNTNTGGVLHMLTSLRAGEQLQARELLLCLLEGPSRAKNSRLGL